MRRFLTVLFWWGTIPLLIFSLWALFQLQTHATTVLAWFAQIAQFASQLAILAVLVALGIGVWKAYRAYDTHQLERKAKQTEIDEKRHRMRIEQQRFKLTRDLALTGRLDGSNVRLADFEMTRMLSGPKTVTVNQEVPEQLALPAPLPTSPSYREIASQIAPGRILLGYGIQGYIWGDITDLLSTAIVGRPGTGKTTMLRFVVAMLLRIGGIPVLWDPHGSIVDELGDVLTVAESGSEIIASSQTVEQELTRRLTARRAGATTFIPMLLIADEWPVIKHTAQGALTTARRIVLEGRKVAMYALICGQGLPAELLGGTLVRDALSSRYIFNTTAQQARMAGLDNDTAKELLSQLDTSGPGRAILASATRRPEIVAIPATTADDIRLLMGSSAEVRREASGSENGTSEVPSVEEALRDIGKRLKKGDNKHDILKSWGITGGRKYQDIGTVIDSIEQEN